MILAIIVTFNPATPPAMLCAALAPRCRVLVVDNSTEPGCAAQLQAWAQPAGYDHLGMGRNAGIAAAQNAGVAFARKAGADGVVFFDQDSLIDAAALAALAEAVERGAPAVYSLVPGEYAAAGIAAPSERRELMSSGSGCRLAIFDTVGPFEAELFIDCVDFEWGWRCRRHGVRIVALRAGSFLHRLGKSRVSALGFSAHIDSPVRVYYQFRNITSMMLRAYVPLAWKCAQLLRSSAKLVLLALVARPRALRVRLAARGVRDGLLGRLGPYVEGGRR